MPAGRPRLIKSPEEMLERGHAFFDECNANKEVITITGLALALGLSGREALCEYGKRSEYSDTVKSLKSVCENFVEKRALETNGAGSIFALKNYGWADKLAIGGTDDLPPIQAEITVNFVKPNGNGGNTENQG